MSKFVQIAVAPTKYEDEADSLYALDEDGTVWQYDLRNNNWWALGTNRDRGHISDEVVP